MNNCKWNSNLVVRPTGTQLLDVAVAVDGFLGQFMTSSWVEILHPLTLRRFIILRLFLDQGRFFSIFIFDFLAHLILSRIEISRTRGGWREVHSTILGGSGSLFIKEGFTLNARDSSVTHINITAYLPWQKMWYFMAGRQSDDVKNMNIM